MQADELLASLKARFARSKTVRITIHADEIAGWPKGIAEQWIQSKLLTQAEPAQALECDGCEQACFMPVNVVAAEGTRPARAFIQCDKRDDMGRVRVTFARLYQWHMSRSGFEKLQAGWVVTSAADTGTRKLRKSKAPVQFRSALEKLLAEIERRAVAGSLSFDRTAMPGRKVDLHAVAEKFDAVLGLAPRTFDDYLDGLCAFRRGSRETDFYRKLFPEFFK